MRLFNFLKSKVTGSKINESDEFDYDEIADRYARYIDDQKVNSLYERPYMLSKLPPLKGLTFLDAGCGSGFYSKYAYEQGARVIAVDKSEKLLQITRAKTENRIETHFADLSKHLTFIPEKSIDVILCSLVLHYLRDWSVPMSEFYRLLKPGALCMISVHHPIYDAQLNQGRYFEKRLIKEEWSGFGREPMPIQYYVRPLKEYLDPLLKTEFSMVEVDEPLPSQEIRQLEPELFKKLSARPIFLFFKLVK
jgi:SAM-dependent methyltransferase